MIQRAFHAFVSDKHGHVVIVQKPNPPIIGWFIFMVISHLLSAGTWQSGTSALSAAFLFTWAYLEITQGVSPFRRVLGTVVSVVVTVGLFL